MDEHDYGQDPEEPGPQLLRLPRQRDILRHRHGVQRLPGIFSHEEYSNYQVFSHTEYSDYHVFSQTEYSDYQVFSLTEYSDYQVFPHKEYSDYQVFN